MCSCTYLETSDLNLFLYFILFSLSHLGSVGILGASARVQLLSKHKINAADHRVNDNSTMVTLDFTRHCQEVDFISIYIYLYIALCIYRDRYR